MAWNWLTPWRAKRKSRQIARERAVSDGEKWEPPKPTPEDGLMYKYL